MTEIDINEVVEYWSGLAQYDIDTAEAMFQTARFPYALYMCHLAIEKILKSIIVRKTSEHAPYTHNLVNLAEKVGIGFSHDQKNLIADLTGFNIEARYPEWKNAFYKTATKDYAQNYLKLTKELFLWLQKYLNM